MKKILSILAAAVLIVGCCACSTQSSGEYPVKIAGYTFNEKPDSVVCLDDSIADILIACGYADRITARSDECTQPEIESIPSVGSKDDPDCQKIFDVDPDVVFADKDIDKKLKDKIEKGGTSVLTMMPAETTDELVTLYENIGALCSGNKTGRESGKDKANSIIMTMGDLQRIVPRSDVELTVCYLYDLEGNAASEDSLAGKLISYTNATNVCGVSSSAQDNLGKIKLSNPDYIFCASGLKNKLAEDNNFKDLKAVKKGNVYEIEALMMSRQGNSITEVISFMIENMYPEVTSSNNKDSSAKESSAEDSNTQSGSSETSANEASENSNTQENSKESKTEESKSEESKPEISADDSLEITDEMSYANGDSDSNIKLIQERLKALGYFDEETTDFFGNYTEQSFRSFEAANQLEEDGTASADDLRLLFSADVKPAVQEDFQINEE